MSSMKDHQKYFHVVNTKGRILPYFISISNIESTDPAQVIAGNERVIRPRLADASFFYDTDQKQPLSSRLEQLKQVVFQTKLGSVYDKCERIANLAGQLSDQINSDAAIAKRAGLLTKADLVTSMVGEFPDLQGIMGCYYAANDDEPEGVPQAIYEHYLPRFSGDELPATLPGCAVSIADSLKST